MERKELKQITGTIDIQNDTYFIKLSSINLLIRFADKVVDDELWIYIGSINEHEPQHYEIKENELQKAVDLITDIILKKEI